MPIPQTHMVAMLGGFAADPQVTAYYNDFSNGFRYAQAYDRDAPRLATRTMKRRMGLERLSYSEALGGYAPAMSASAQAHALGYLGAAPQFLDLSLGMQQNKPDLTDPRTFTGGLLNPVLQETSEIVQPKSDPGAPQYAPPQEEGTSWLPLLGAALIGLKLLKAAST